MERQKGIISTLWSREIISVVLSGGITPYTTNLFQRVIVGARLGLF